MIRAIVCSLFHRRHHHCFSMIRPAVTALGSNWCCSKCGRFWYKHNLRYP